jgi:hypothetical protein
LLFGTAEIIFEEAVVPDAVGAFELNNRIFKTDIAKHNAVFKEEPVSDVHLNGPGVEQGIVVLIMYQGAFEHHFIEQGKVNVFDLNLGVEVFGKFARNLFYQPVLDQ